MKLFKSDQPNILHYVTTVMFQRVPVFRSNQARQLFIESLAETRKHRDFNLIGYVIMPDHVHLILNPRVKHLSEVIRRLKSSSARLIPDWLRRAKHSASLGRLQLENPQSRRHTHALWQKSFSTIGLWTPRFILQKLSYVHLNPVRAQLCDHPGQWQWSSYSAYSKHQAVAVPIEVDSHGYLNEALESGRDGGQRPPLTQRSIKILGFSL